MVSKPSHPHAGQKCHLPIFFKPLILKGYGAVKKQMLGAASHFLAHEPMSAVISGEVCKRKKHVCCLRR